MRQKLDRRLDRMRSYSGRGSRMKLKTVVGRGEKEKKKEARHQLDLIEKMRECISTQ